MSVEIKDLITNKPIPNAFMELWKEGMQQPDEGVSNGEGNYEF